MNIKRFSLFFSLILALVLFSAVRAAQPTYQEAGDPLLEVVVEKAMRQHKVPGASVAILKSGELSWARGYGMADPIQRIPVSSDTVFQAASIAKPVTAWGIMTLVEDGLLDLDAPIEQYLTRWHLPESEFDHNQITIRRILSHTAGLSTDGDTGVDPDAYVPTVEEALNGAVLGMRPLHVATQPGEDYHYSSIGYTLLEIAIEEVTGESFSGYMQREVLDPLGMVHSSYEWTPELRERAAVGHNWHNRPLPVYQYSTHAQGSLLTTATDLATFMAASMPGPNGEPVGRGVLAPESVTEILTPVPFANQAKSSHIAGLGYDLIGVDESITGARKTGDHRGYKPIIVMDLQSGDGIAIMTNSDRAAIGFVMDIACAWSKTLSSNPLKADCGELMMIRNVQLITASVLALGALAYILWVVIGFRNGRRRLNWKFSWGKAVRVAIPLIILAVWWIGWHTDTLFAGILHRYPSGGYAVTIRALIPWPTAFVWISWAVTLWLLAWIAVVFVPKLKKPAAPVGSS